MPNTDVLVLLTNQFPAPYGDSSFISNEIDILAQSFDQVLIWSYAKSADNPLSLPLNVEYMGDLSIKSIWTSLSPIHLRRVIGSFSNLLSGERKTKSIHSFRQLERAVKHGLHTCLAAVNIENTLSKRDLQIEDVYLYAFWGMNCGLPLALLGSASRASYVRVHGYDLYEDRSGGYIPFRRSLFESVDRIIPISADGANYIRTHYPEYLPKTSVHRLGTKDHGVGNAPKADPPVVASCSNVVPLKRVSLIYQALRIAANTRPLQWVHFGGGAGLEELQRTVASEKHPNLSVALKGSTPNSDVLDYYSSTHVSAFVNLSETEGVPVSIMEAMSFDIPVVATDVGGTSELVSGQENPGLLVPATVTAEEAARALLAVVQKEAEFSPRQRWSTTSDTDRQTSELVKMIKSV